MPRVVLIHWNAQEAGPRLEALRRAGAETTLSVPQGGAGFRAFDATPPDAFVIDLTRLPSQGRAVGVELRRRKSTRDVPLLFAGGEAEKVERTRQVLPDACYAEWPAVAAALRRALRGTPAAPLAVPGTMAAYQGTPLVRKLGIKPGEVVRMAGSPPGFERKVEPLPEGAHLTTRARSADRVLLFVRSRADLARRFDNAAAIVKSRGALWIVWPKQASGHRNDLSQPVVRRFAMDLGWVDYKICAVDETWSGLLFSRRPRPPR